MTDSQTMPAYLTILLLLIVIICYRLRENVYSVNDLISERVFVFVSDQLTAFGHSTENVVQAGHDDHTEHSAEEHASQGRCTNRAVTDCACAMRDHERNQSGNESKRRHQYRTKAHPGTFDRSGKNRCALMMFLNS